MLHFGSSVNSVSEGISIEIGVLTPETSREIVTIITDLSLN